MLPQLFLGVFAILKYSLFASGQSLGNLLFIGYTSYGKQFYTDNVLLNLTNAEAFCSSRNCNLGSVDSYDEAVIISQWATTLNYQNYVMSSYSVGSGAVPFQSQNCLESSSILNESTWVSAQCSGLGHPLCVTNYTAPVPLPETIFSEELLFIGNSTLNGITKELYGYLPPTRWSKAYDTCKSRGLALATLDRDEDQWTVMRWAVGGISTKVSSFWTAGTNKLTGDYVWITNGQTIPRRGSDDTRFQFWAEGQPRHALAGNGCLTTFLSSDPVWYSVPCWQGRPALCMRVSQN